MVNTKPLLVDKAVIGLPKLLGDIDFNNPTFTMMLKNFIVGTFMKANQDQFKYEIHHFTGREDEFAMGDALELHVEQCVTEFKELARHYKIKALTQRFI